MENLKNVEKLIAKCDEESQSKKIRKEALTVTYVPGTKSWHQKYTYADKKTKGKRYMSLASAFESMRNFTPQKKGYDIDVAVLIDSAEDDDGAMTTWLIAADPDIDNEGNAKYETVSIHLSKAELEACDERIAFYDGYYLYPLTKESHATVGRILGLSGQFDALNETAILPVGLALVMSASLMKKGTLRLIYSTRRHALKKVRPLMGLSLMDPDSMLSHEKVFSIMEKALSEHCIWSVSSYEISENSISVECDITYPFKGKAVLYDGCVPGDGATVGIDIHDGEAVMRAGSTSFGHASKDATVFERISKAIADGENFALAYQAEKDRNAVFSPEYAETVFSCIGKLRKQKSSGMRFVQGTVSDIMKETARAYGTNELNTYKEGKLFEAYAEEARNLMKAVKSHD